VTTDLQDADLWSQELKLEACHWINGEPDRTAGYTARTRYRADLIAVTDLHKTGTDTWVVKLAHEVRALTPGQSTVLYDGDRVVGGGIVV
jgi:tRNA-specific 2-thiouridylase